MKKKEMNYYFQTFVKLFEFANQAALYLEKVVLNFNDGITEEQKDEMHAIEHGADLCLHDAFDKLAKEFITPIENEDILNIIRKIDDATDMIEDVLIKLYIRDVKTLPKCANQFVDIIKRECVAVSKVLEEFPNFKKSNTINTQILDVLSIEEEGDKLYITSIKELYRNVTDARELFITEDIICAFEACCDAVEKIAKQVDEAIMKNS